MDYGHKPIPEIRALMHQLADQIEAGKMEPRGMAMSLRWLAEQTRRKPCARGIRAPVQVPPLTDKERRKIVRTVLKYHWLTQEKIAARLGTSLGRVSETMDLWREGKLKVDGCVPV